MKYLLLFLLMLPTIYAVSYSDVLLVRNNQSSNSINITATFIAAHPDVNVVNISTADTETITFATFNTSIRAPIEAYLIAAGPASINYIVTTKGVPLRYPASVACRGGSVDSTLSIILSRYNASICLGNTTFSGIVASPAFLQVNHINKSSYDFYMVTRIDGYTVNDANRLIHSNSTIDLVGNILLDRRPDKTGGYAVWDVRMDSAKTVIESKNYTTLYDNTTTFITNRANLSGYISWGSNDGSAAANSSTWNLSFTLGAIGDTAVSTSARSLNPGTTYGQSLIADLIAMNITGVKGYVYEPYLMAVSYPEVLYDRYLSNYTLAESFYMSGAYINWMEVVIGDPKIIIVRTGTENVSSVNNQYCYQESANTTNQTGIDTCPSDYNGKYDFSDSIFYINYTKPSISTTSNSKLLFKGADETIKNLSIPQSCYEYSVQKLLFMINTTNNGTYPCIYPRSQVYCYNGSWTNITGIDINANCIASTGGANINYKLYDGDFTTGGYYQSLIGAFADADYLNIFEEAMWWYTTIPVTQNSTITEIRKLSIGNKTVRIYG